MPPRRASRVAPLDPLRRPSCSLPACFLPPSTDRRPGATGVIAVPVAAGVAGAHCRPEDRSCRQLRSGLGRQAGCFMVRTRDRVRREFRGGAGGPAIGPVDARSRRLGRTARPAAYAGARAEGRSRQDLDPRPGRAISRLHRRCEEAQAGDCRRLSGDGGMARLPQILPAAAQGSGSGSEPRGAGASAPAPPAAAQCDARGGGAAARARLSRPRRLQARRTRGAARDPQVRLAGRPLRSHLHLWRRPRAFGAGDPHRRAPAGDDPRRGVGPDRAAARNSDRLDDDRGLPSRYAGRGIPQVGARLELRRHARACPAGPARLRAAGAVRPALRARGMSGPDEELRAVEAALFASEEPMTVADIRAYVGEDADVPAALQALAGHYSGRGFELVERGGRWHFQTAPDLAHILRREREEPRKLSRAAIETLAIIAYHEPVSRAEIEAIRGVQISKGTLDVLMDAGWVRPAGRREVPGRPLTYATTAHFLTHFGLQSRRDLPGIDDLKAAGLLDPIDLAIEQLELESAAEED